MIDFSFIGKEGLIIEYEDLVSLIGFNIVKYLRKNNINNDAISRMPIKDILLNYINREDEDVEQWLSKSFNIDIKLEDFKSSINTFQPNLMYAFKILDSAYKNGIKNLYIHSKFESNVISEAITKLFTIPIKYVYGDIIPIITECKNYTYITSSTENIRKCSTLNTPFELVIVDDFIYVASVMETINELHKKPNIVVRFTSVLTAGFI